MVELLLQSELFSFLAEVLEGDGLEILVETPGGLCPDGLGDALIVELALLLATLRRITSYNVCYTKLLR